jgi:hypothetical protein
MQENSKRFYYDFESEGKEFLRRIGQVLSNSGDLSKYVAQCWHSECGTFWFAGGEWEIANKLEQKPIRFQILKKAILMLNRAIATADQLESVGLRDISHAPCRPCNRERRLEDFRNQQRKKHFPPCFGTKQIGETCEYEICARDRKWDCSHPCTIHPEREAIRKKRMDILSQHYQHEITRAAS